MVTVFEQGDIVCLVFDPQPAMSSNLFNRVSCLTMVCPITSTDRGQTLIKRIAHSGTYLFMLCSLPDISLAARFATD